MTAFEVFLLLFAAVCVAVLIVMPAYQRANIAAAKAAVASAASAIARGEFPTDLWLRDSVDRPSLSKAFASGWQISGYDAIGFSFSGYEIMVRVRGDGQYNFDASRSNGSWHPACCEHLSESEMRDRAAP